MSQQATTPVTGTGTTSAPRPAHKHALDVAHPPPAPETSVPSCSPWRWSC